MQTPAPVLMTSVAGIVPVELVEVFRSAGFQPAVLIREQITHEILIDQSLILLHTTDATLATGLGLCRRWRLELGDFPLPILVVTAGSSAGLATALEGGADAALPIHAEPSLLIAQARALLRNREIQARLASRAVEASKINQRLQSAYQQMDSDLELARRLHRNFLPSKLTDICGTSFGVCYRPRSRVGGDFYDVLRLDEEHCAVLVADAMGRGIPTSSLMSVFVKKCLTMKEITGRSYRLVPPEEVLQRLNRDLLSLGMAEPPFVTMLFVQLNCRDGYLSFSRAAHPHPLYIPAIGDPEYWQSPGTLLGVFEADFPSDGRQLKPGDKVLLSTDGAHTPGNSSLVTPASEQLRQAAAHNRHLPAQAFVDAVAAEMLERYRLPDDFTLLAFEYRG